MFGKVGSPQCKLKGHETLCFLRFIHKHLTDLGQDDWASGAGHLIAIYDNLQLEPTEDVQDAPS
eukprot:2085188-Amphidinium_carterae.1